MKSPSKPKFLILSPPSGKMLDDKFYFTKLYGYIIHWTDVEAYRRYIKDIQY